MLNELVIPSNDGGFVTPEIGTALAARALAEKSSNALLAGL
jgi:hypothetical protein